MAAVWHWVSNLLVVLAVLTLLFGLIDFLWRRRSTAWLATALLFFVPLWFGVGFITCEVYWIVTDECLTSDASFEALTIISAAFTLVVSVRTALDDYPPVLRREKGLHKKWDKWAAQYASSVMNKPR